MIDLEDVATVLGRDLTNEEIARVARLVELAAGLIEGALPGFTLAAGTETVTVYPNGDTLWTPRYPLSAEPTVTVNGSALTDPKWDQWGRIRFSASTLNEWELNGWSSSGVDVDYPFGFAELPLDVTLTIAAMVAAVIRRQAANPDNVLNEQLGAYAVGYGASEQQAAAVGLVFPDGALRRWKRNTQAAVPLVRR